MDLTLWSILPPDKKLEQLAQELHKTQLRMNGLILENEEMRERINQLEARERARR